MRHVALVIVAIAAFTGRADAQSAAIAEQLFNEARELGKAGRWQEACPKFLASLQHDPTLGTRLNLANCYERIGKLATAWGLYRESVAIARRSNDNRAAYAQKQADALEPRLPKLVISGPAQAVAGLVVQRDGTTVTSAELGLALYVDPGAHEVTASAPGFVSFSQKITLQEGAVETLTLPALAPAPAAQTPLEKSSTEPEEEEEVDVAVTTTSSTQKYVGLGIGGAGVLAVTAGLVFGSQAMSANDKAKELCGAELQCSPGDFAQGKRYIDDGRSKATLSTAFVIAGGAGIVAGAVVYFLASRGDGEQPRAARLVPVIHGAGIGVAGSF